MSAEPTKTTFAGLDLASQLGEFEPEVTVPRSDPKALAAVGAAAGFPSREPQPPRPQPEKREQVFNTRVTVRVIEGDKKRFEDLAYALRVPNGEAFRRLLDHWEQTGGDSRAQDE